MSNLQDQHEEDEIFRDEDAAEEYIPSDQDEIMDSGSDGEGDEAMQDEEMVLASDAIAYFEGHADSVFAIAQHPQFPALVATGGSEGDDEAPGKGFLIDTSAAVSAPALPYTEEGRRAATELAAKFSIDGHKDSVTSLAFTTDGKFLVSGGMDGFVRLYAVAASSEALKFKFVAETNEVQEIVWLAASPAHPHTFAAGAGDGSVWVYTVKKSEPLSLQASYFIHTASCTAGQWTPDGKLLCSVSEDGSLAVYDVFSYYIERNMGNGQTVLSISPEDQRFEVEGGLYSLAVDQKGSVLAVAGTGGAIRVISLPNDNSIGGVIVASLSTLPDAIETLSFSSELLAAGCVDGSIAVYDPSKRFAMRRTLTGAHGEHAVVKVEFVPNNPWHLTSCGTDGVVRRWDMRSGDKKEWLGHRGGDQGGGVLGFVQGSTGDRVVTVGDDGVVLVFEV